MCRSSRSARTRTKEFGLNLSDYAIQGVFSPEVDPRGHRWQPERRRAFNANTISRGISASDFYLAVPSAVVRFLETDQRTKVMAKPQLRGAEGVDDPVQSRRGDPGAVDGVHADRRRRLERQSADVVQLPTDRHHRRR